MNALSEIKRSIQNIAGGRGLVSFTAKVKSVQGETCTIEVEGSELTDVRLRSVVNGEKSKLLIMPKVGSYIIVIDNSQGNLTELVVVAFSEIEKIEINTETEIVFNGGDNDGLVKIRKLEKNLKEIKTYCEALKAATGAGISAVGVGAAASGTAGQTAFETTMSGKSIVFEDMENVKIKH